MPEHKEYYPCCDNPDCPLCYGSGIYRPKTLREKADEVLKLIAVSDLNQDEARRAIRDLAESVKQEESNHA